MAYEYSDLVTQAKDWAKQTIDSDWATETELNTLLEYDARTPDTLFNDSQSRPLIVAFLGGTGVGKSTLLNRLAGRNIARTGIVRPTSTEVTLFHHKRVKIAQLPSKLPLDKIQIAEHTEASNQHIIWIDMPDFDSTVQSNQLLVLEWLPHIDVLVYVVSPERYRDNKAWQILKAEGGKHAWMFVLNQADRGQPEQYQDFIKQLGKAGFGNPVVYQTCCADEKPADQIDEFDTLQATLQGLATDKTIEQLELRGMYARKLELSQQLGTSIGVLGPVTAADKLLTFWQEHWQGLEQLLIEATALPIQQMSKYYGAHSGDLADRQKELSLHDSLWDQWAQTRFEDGLDALVLQADYFDLPVTPLKQLLIPIGENSEKIVEEKTLLWVRKALIKPGNIVQRTFIKIAQIAEIILPIAAMSWVSYQVFIEFYEGSIAEIPHYVGTDFAINSGMLIAISWLFPYFLQKKLKPSIEKAALKGLNNGFKTAMQTLEIDVLEEIKANSKTQEVLREQAMELIEQCQKESALKLNIPKNSDLERMLL